MDNKSHNQKILFHEQKRNMRRVRWLIFWVMVSLSIISVVISAIFTFLQTTVMLNYARMIFTHILAILIPLIIYFKVSGANTHKISMRLNKFSVAEALIIIIIAMAGQFIMAIINIPMRILQDTVLINTSVGLLPGNNLELAVGIFAVAIIPSIFEEILFRGVFFGSMERQSTLFAVMFSTFIFALLHMDIFGFFGYIFLGLMTVMVMLRTNSLYAAILLHFVNNLTALIFEYLNNVVYISDRVIVGLILGSIVVFIAGVFIFKIITPNPPKNKSKYVTKLLLQNIFSLPIILGVLISILIQWLPFFV